MWTDTNRAQYAREDLALPSDLTEAEWAVLEPDVPPPSHVDLAAKGSGRFPIWMVLQIWWLSAAPAIVQGFKGLPVGA